MMEHRELRELTKLKKFDISIQASSRHYSTPREWLPNIEDYTHVETALFTKTGDWVNPHTSVLLKDFTQLNELLTLYDDDDISSVGAYVPVELVQQLINYGSK